MRPGFVSAAPASEGCAEADGVGVLVGSADLVSAAGSPWATAGGAISKTGPRGTEAPSPTAASLTSAAEAPPLSVRIENPSTDAVQRLPTTRDFQTFFGVGRESGLKAALLATTFDEVLGTPATGTDFIPCTDGRGPGAAVAVLGGPWISVIARVAARAAHVVLLRIIRSPSRCRSTRPSCW